MVTPANKRGWGWPGEPGSDADRRYQATHLTTVTAGGVRLRVRKEVADLFVGFIGELTRGGYRLNVRADDWGYANRDVRGRPGVKSNHAWGLAVDLNATTNPMTNDGRNHTDLPPGISKLAAKYGLRWGGDYSGSRKDPMHFEFTGTPADAQAYKAHLAKKAAAQTSAPVEPKPQPKTEPKPKVSGGKMFIVNAKGDDHQYLVQDKGGTHIPDAKTMAELQESGVPRLRDKDPAFVKGVVSGGANPS